jgi:hypothetical protein
MIGYKTGNPRRTDVNLLLIYGGENISKKLENIFLSK